MISAEDLLWFNNCCSRVVFRYVPPIYLLTPSMSLDLLMNLGFDKIVLLTFGRLLKTSKS